MGEMQECSFEIKVCSALLSDGGRRPERCMIFSIVITWLLPIPGSQMERGAARDVLVVWVGSSLQQQNQTLH